MSVFAASGDSGAYYGLSYPSASPEVVSVGGTSLYLNANNTYNDETGWSTGYYYGGSGGGYSQAFSIPPYQQTDGFAGNNGERTNPDVAADADPYTGVAVYDPYDFGSATPWDFGRRHQPGDAAVGRHGRHRRPGPRPGRRRAAGLDRDADGPLHPGQHRPRRLPRHHPGHTTATPPDPGYDLVTGLGSPEANLLIPDLAAFGLASTATIATQPPSSVVAGASFGIIAAATDSFGVTDLSYDGTRHAHAGQRPERGHVHAGDRPGHGRHGGLPRTCRWAARRAATPSASR